MPGPQHLLHADSHHIKITAVVRYGSDSGLGPLVYVMYWYPRYAHTIWPGTNLAANQASGMTQHFRKIVRVN